MEDLILIANLGHVRTIGFRRAGDDPRDREHLMETPGGMVDMKLASIGEVVTDQPGRFAQGVAADRKGGTSSGEEHNLQAELDRQALDRVAETLATIVERNGRPAWRLVAPPAILPALKAALPAAARKCLADTTAGDLTRAPLAELERRFLRS